MRLRLIIYFSVISSFVYSQELNEKIDDLINGYINIGEFNGCYLLANNGEIIKNNCYGIKSSFSNDSIDISSKFHLGSITKQFTAVAILILYEKDYLSLNDSIFKFFDDLPVSFNNITIKHLLSNTSGIPDYFDYIPYPDSTTNQKVFDCIKSMDALNFAPGDNYRYSNSCWVLLALIIEKVSGMSYSEFLKQYIFDPAGMNNTYLIDIKKERPENTTVGFKSKNSTTEHIVYYNDEGDYEHYTNGDGGIISTILDLYKWDSILNTEKLLRKEIMDLMYNPVELNNGKTIYYGFGWYTKNYPNGKTVWHGGDLGGCHCMIYRELDTRSLFVILQNGGSHRNWEIKKKVNRMLNNWPYTIPKKRIPIVIDTSCYYQYVGDYQLENGQKIFITNESGQLQSQFTERGEIRNIYPESLYNFYIKEIDAQLTFINDNPDIINGLIFHNETDKFAKKIVHTE